MALFETVFFTTILICLAGVVYPFWPFSSRRVAASVGVGVFLAGAMIMPKKMEEPSSRAASLPVRSIPVPSDTRANYEAIEVSSANNGSVVVISKRTGPSGVSYSRRECECRDGTFRYLGEGDTLDAARNSNASDKAMTKLVRDPKTGLGSVSFHVCNFACEEARTGVPKTSTIAPSKVEGKFPEPSAKLSEFDIRSRALVLCMRYAKSSARHPSTVNFSGWGSNVDVRGDGSALVTSTFTARNSFNLEIEHDIRCDVSSAGEIKAKIAER